MDMDKIEILKTLHNNMANIKKYGVSNIGLFGSYSSYQNSESSDIDILVHFKEGRKSFDNYMDLRFFLEDMFKGHNVDLVIDDTVKPALKDYILDTVEYAT